ncbi:MAG: hypothetical protein OES32_11955 [Acidobacteriota bacterium]|nr:hypothetical protein [Acidobacteriota bacterium]
MFGSRELRVATWLLSVVLLAAAPSAAQRTRIADFAAGGAQAEWTPLAGDYDHLVLTVAGPGGSFLRQEFPAGVRPTFGLFDDAGFALPDGLYKWELAFVPRVDPEMRDLLAAAGDDGQRGLEKLGLVERSRQSGSFSIADGGFVPTDLTEPDPVAVEGGGGDRASIPVDPQGVVLSNSDGVIRNSLCVGFDCPNSPAFGDSTILLMENNTRIKFGDTSNLAGFPNRDWEIEANSASSGGANYLGFNDCGTADNDGGCATDLVFAVEAGARSSALYVESDGDIGVGTSNPVVDVHVVTGNTPTLRLDQDGSGGFAPQVWDVAGNETNFFVRDATNGSALPLRIRPGAPSNSIFVDVDGDVGIGTSSPGNPLHVRRTDGTAQIKVEDTSAGNQQMLLLEKTTNAPFVRFTSQFGNWDFVAGNSFIITDPSTGANELSLSRTGDLTINGQCSEGGSGSCADYVFEPGYELLPLGELQAFIRENRHLPNVPSTSQIQEQGLNVQHFQGRLLEKVEELVLYTLEQQSTIDALTARLEALEAGREVQ